MAITVTNIVYRGGGATVTFSNGVMADMQYQVVDGVFNVYGLTSEQLEAYRAFHTGISNPYPFFPTPPTPEPDPTRNVGHFSFRDNLTPTIVDQSNTYYKALGTNSVGYGVGFTVQNNKLIFTGSITTKFLAIITGTVSSGNNNVVGVSIFKGGVFYPDSEVHITTNTSGRVETFATNTLIDLSTNNYIELWVENRTGSNNITLSDVSVTLISIA